MFLCDILVEQHESVQPPVESDVNQQDSKDSSIDQQAPPQQYSDEDEDEELTDESPENEECVPIKRFYLLTKLKKIKDILKQYNIVDSDFDLLLKFVNSLSYNTLLFISDKMIQAVEARIKNVEE
ncbi:MAG: hypothetical protein PHD05_01295 [Sphaerochaetaceae bacterium]|nr:hypothetical protein [Sphaerochaetaceae bacterium]